MRYLCLLYVDENVLAALPASSLRVLNAEWHDYRAQLQRSGELIVGEVMQSVLSTTTLERQGDRLLLRDGPRFGCCEQPAAICLLDTHDLNDAIRLASRLPPARLGCIEVRALGSRAPP